MTLLERVIQLLEQRNKLDAVMLVRKETHWRISESKTIVERIELMRKWSLD